MISVFPDLRLHKCTCMQECSLCMSKHREREKEKERERERRPTSDSCGERVGKLVHILLLLFLLVVTATEDDRHRSLHEYQTLPVASLPRRQHSQPLNTRSLQTLCQHKLQSDAAQYRVGSSHGQSYLQSPYRGSLRAHLHVMGMLRFMSDINQPSLPTPFYSVLMPISVFMALSTVFHPVNSPDNSPLPYWSFQLHISL